MSLKEGAEEHEGEAKDEQRRKDRVSELRGKAVGGPEEGGRRGGRQWHAGTFVLFLLGVGQAPSAPFCLCQHWGTFSTPRLSRL